MRGGVLTSTHGEYLNHFLRILGVRAEDDPVEGLRSSLTSARFQCQEMRGRRQSVTDHTPKGLIKLVAVNHSIPAVFGWTSVQRLL